jgi:hypothetical protein
MIVYNNKFKVAAVCEYHKGLSPSQIFRQAGFNIDMIGREIPKESLRRWLMTCREKGLLADKSMTRKNGGRPRASRYLLRVFLIRKM